MIRKIRFLLLLLCLLHNNSALNAQTKNKENEEKFFIKLLNGVNEKKGLQKRKAHIDSVIEIAKEKKNYRFQFASYHVLGLIHNNELMLTYSDSIIRSCRLHSYEDEFYPVDAYQLKGDFFTKKKITSEH